MEPTPTQPRPGYPGSASPSYSASTDAAAPTADGQFSTTAAHATGTGKYPTDYGQASQPTPSGVQDTLSNALASGKKWLNDSGLSDKAQQLPQTAKDLGNKAINSVSGLTTTQKAVGVGLLAAGVAFLVTRGKSKPKHKHKKHKHDEAERSFKGSRSPFDRKPRGAADDQAAGPRAQQRPWGSNRYGSNAAPASTGRVSSGSGYTSSPAPHSADHGSRTSSDNSTSVGSGSFSGSSRRDQGPASGSRYDASASGGQNPNNLDQLNSAF